ncbi:hypothetical protein [Sphingobacterium sp. UDSM-2020]|uniref:hypothetical protein n=1 Tax=Sphingobacterium sp. UDSM-2020 TaxID=2795738 RepID=UPI00193694B9|nr:hypothetical protein [Sphingobacterium sp. UDSM-2020]QQD11623.1 hypothetical protein JAZ75_13375 [Sphingobacterium sp. UDSM-2020]
MLQIEYKIIDEFVGEIENISDEEISYSFLLGNVSLISSNAMIEMDWEWIPLLDFAYCLKAIAKNITINDKSKECFEFTENAETINFSKEVNQLKISASFSPVVILTTVKDFEIATTEFHSIISNYIRKHIVLKDPPKKLQKYLSIDV